MAEFRYVSSESSLEQTVQTAINDWMPRDAVAFRWQLFVWAHLVAEAMKQCRDHDLHVSSLFWERIEAAQKYWPAEVEDLQKMQFEHGTVSVNVLSPTSFTLSLSRTIRGQRPTVRFALDQHGITVRSVDAPPFPLPVREPSSPQDAMNVARALVKRALELLEPFEGKKPVTPV